MHPSLRAFLIVVGNLKTVISMAVSLIFHGTDETANRQIDILCTETNRIEITIDEGNNYPHFILLDVQTAVKFSKELRKLIAEAKEVDNV